MRFQRSDHYAILAALPQIETTDAPLYLLMRFEGVENTGDTYADSHSNSPLLFPSLAWADRFAARYAPEYRGVGLDQIYWPFFRASISEHSGTVVLVLDADGTKGKARPPGRGGPRLVWRICPDPLTFALSAGPPGDPIAFRT